MSSNLIKISEFYCDKRDCMLDSNKWNLRKLLAKKMARVLNFFFCFHFFQLLSLSSNVEAQIMLAKIYSLNFMISDLFQTLSIHFTISRNFTGRNLARMLQAYSHGKDTVKCYKGMGICTPL